MTRRRRIVWGGVGSLLALIILITPTTNWLTTFFQLPLVVNEQPQKSDVIIVLGAGARKHGEPLPPQAKERIQVGVRLLRDGYAPTVIMAGGLSRQSGYVESRLMKPYAESLGLSADQIVEEDGSHNTWENAVNSLAIMKNHDWKSALVVTSSYHTFRACTIFRKLKAAVRCIAAPLDTIPTDTVYERLTDLRSVVREYGAIVYFVGKHQI